MRVLILIASAVAAAVALATPAPAQDTAGNAAGTQEAQEVLLAVELTPQPMVYVSSSASMDPKEIEGVMNAAFEALGKFLGETQVTPLGPPLAIYSNWTEGRMTVEVGFPVSEADAQKAAGDIKSGMTPGGHAIKAIHLGPYDSLADTYAAIQAQMEAAGIAQSQLAWEVYVGEPGVTPDAELITEIYMQVSAEDAAKLPAN